MKPYKEHVIQTGLGDIVRIREIKSDVEDSKLIWHRDKKTRHIYILSGKNWKLQLDDKLPVVLSYHKWYNIPAETYHRVIKGDESLIFLIEELEEE